MGGCGESYGLKLEAVFETGMAAHDVDSRGLQVLLHLVGKDWHTGTAPVKWAEVVEKVLGPGEEGGDERRTRGRGRR